MQSERRRSGDGPPTKAVRRGRRGEVSALSTFRVRCDQQMQLATTYFDRPQPIAPGSRKRAQTVVHTSEPRECDGIATNVARDDKSRATDFASFGDPFHGVEDGFVARAV